MKNSEVKRVIFRLYELASRGDYAPLLIWGEAGIGKSETVKSAAAELDIDFVDLRLGNLEATDLMGLMRDEVVYPCIFDFDSGPNALRAGERFTAAGLWHYVRLHYSDRIPASLESDPIGFVQWNEKQLLDLGYGVLIENRTVYSAPSWFPGVDTHGILFLDELNRSQRETRQGVFQLILDRRIHELELPPGWIIVSANNPPSSTDDSGLSSYDVDDIEDKAFMNRFCHVVLDASASEWADYARSAGIDPTIRTLLAPSSEHDDRARKLLGLRAAELPALEPTPRGWSMLSRIWDPESMPVSSPVTREIVQGIVGAKAWDGERREIQPASSFLSFISDPSNAWLIEVERLVDLASSASPEFKKEYELFMKDASETRRYALQTALEESVPTYRSLGVQ